MNQKIDRTRINNICRACPADTAHPHIWDAKRGGYVCWLTDDVLSPDDLIQDPHDRRGVPQTDAQLNISIKKFPILGLPLQAVFVGHKQVEAMDGQIRDALVVMWREHLPGARLPHSRTSYFALTPNGREWEYLGEARL